MGWVLGGQDVVLYKDNECITVRKSIRAKKTLMVLIHMFERLIIKKNMGKKKVMVCTPIFIWR